MELLIAPPGHNTLAFLISLSQAVAGTAVNAGKVLAHIEPLDGTHIIRPDEFAHPCQGPTGGRTLLLCIQKIFRNAI